MRPVGFEPTISAGERPQTDALDRAATGTGTKYGYPCIFLLVYFNSLLEGVPTSKLQSFVIKSWCTECDGCYDFVFSTAYKLKNHFKTMSIRTDIHMV